MSKQSTHLLNGKEVLLVEVPENQHSFHIDDKGVLRSYHNEGERLQPTGGYTIGHYAFLPPGNWTLIGLAGEVSEEVAKRVVECQFDTYRNYEDTDDIGNHSCYTCTTSVESLHSFILSHNYKPDTTVILIKQ